MIIKRQLEKSADIKMKKGLFCFRENRGNATIKWDTKKFVLVGEIFWNFQENIFPFYVGRRGVGGKLLLNFFIYIKN